MRKCIKCGAEKDLLEFPIATTRKDGSPLRRFTCKSCRNSECRQRYQIHKKINPELLKKRHRQNHLVVDWKMSIPEYQQLLANQNYSCVICQINLQSLPSRLVHIDHNHQTGEKRGILCHNCNVALGLFKDSAALCKKAAEYLEYNSPRVLNAPQSAKMYAEQ